MASMKAPMRQMWLIRSVILTTTIIDHATDFNVEKQKMVKIVNILGSDFADLLHG